MVGKHGVNRRGWCDEDEVVARLDFGLATETEELDGAFRLLHDNYVRGGHMAPHPSGRRVGIFNALPSTRVFVAKDGDRVVGTIALFLDSAIGLPMDQVYREELNARRARGRRLGEAGTLAVHRDYRALGAAILARLFRMLGLYAARVARLHELVMVVSPHHVRFYETCFPIRQFGSLRPYPRVNGTRVVGLVGDLATTRALIRVARFGVSLAGSRDFFFGPRHCRPVLARLRRDAARAAMTPDQVAHFFADSDAASLALATGLATTAARELQLTA
jgi:N-acyl amino acid synthase FeeM